MSVFDNAAQLENAAYYLFNRLKEEHPRAANRVLGARLLVLLRTTDPEALLWLNGRRPPLSIGFGPARLRPDLEIQLSGDTLHDILSGELSLAGAYKSGLVQVNGPIWRAGVLGGFFSHARTVYDDALREAGVTI